LPNLYIIISIYKISLIHYNIITNGRYKIDGVIAIENYNIYISFMKIYSSISQNELRKAANIVLWSLKFYATTFHLTSQKMMMYFMP